MVMIACVRRRSKRVHQDYRVTRHDDKAQTRSPHQHIVTLLLAPDFLLRFRTATFPYSISRNFNRAATTMAENDATVLSQGVGYGVVVGIGFFFSVVMIGISMLQVFSQTVEVVTRIDALLEQIHSVFYEDVRRVQHR